VPPDGVVGVVPPAGAVPPVPVPPVPVPSVPVPDPPTPGGTGGAVSSPYS